MCYVRKTASEVKQHNRPIMNLEEWLSVAEKMREQGTLYLLLTGGEPFLWPDFWKLYEKLHHMGFLISINTNGTLLDASSIQRLQQMPPVRLNITLYGASDDTYFRLCGVHGMYTRVVHAIEGLKEAGIQVKLNGSITPENAGDLDQLIDYAQSRKLVLQATSYMFPPLRRDGSMVGKNERFTPAQAAYYRLHIYRRQFGEERYHRYLQKVLAGMDEPLSLDESCTDPLDGKVRCRAGKAAFWVTWDGYMSLCGVIPGYKTDLRQEGFEKSWEEISRMSDEMVLSGTCGKCKNITICHSCAAMSVTESGKSEGIPRYLCEMVAAMKQLARKELQLETEGKQLQ